MRAARRRRLARRRRGACRLRSSRGATRSPSRRSWRRSFLDEAQAAGEAPRPAEESRGAPCWSRLTAQLQPAFVPADQPLWCPFVSQKTRKSFLFIGNFFPLFLRSLSQFV